ncbi:MAG: ATP-binding protein [Armatimonadota bacterium]
MKNNVLIERLSFHNPWWHTGMVPSAFLPEFKRNIYARLYSYLQGKRAVLLKGPRRVGKTTLFYQLINTLIEEKVSPVDICYLSFDDPILRVSLDDIFKAYEQYRGKELNKGRVYFFLDEAQFLKNWEFTVKLYVDRKFPTTFFISGSSISLLTQKTESLAGRTVEEILFPFSFKEYLSFSAPHIAASSHIKQEELFTDNFPAGLIPFSGEIKVHFANFLREGGFPQLYSEDKDLHNRFIKEDILDKVIFRDIVELYKIREPSYLEKIFYYLGAATSFIINVTTISRLMGVSREVVERYISYIEKSLLYFRLPKFSKALKESSRSNPKGHLIDPSLANFFSASPDQVFESLIASSLFTRSQKNLYFWRDQIHEVDCIIKDKEIIPIEVKNSQRQEIPKNLLYIMEKNKLTRGYVVYQGEFQIQKFRNKEVIFYPAWYFLVLC